MEKNTQIFKISSSTIPLKVLRVSIEVVTACDLFSSLQQR